jgi:hypothetical protein
MSITTQAFRFALTTAALCAAATTVLAKPKRVVILDFDGPRQLADAGRSSVMSILGDQYDVVSTKRWEQARATASQQAHGPEQWSKAAKQSGVGAVIEGVVQDEGRRKMLNVTVRQADNGKEFDTISVRLDGKNGLSTEGSRQLQASLDDILYWIDTGANEATPVYPSIAAKRSRIKDASDAKDARRDHAQANGAQANGAQANGAQAEAVEADSAEADGAQSDDARPTRPARAARSAKPSAAPEPATAAAPNDAAPAHDARPTTVGAADPEVHDLQVLFPPSGEDVERLDPKLKHVAQPTPRFMIDGGGYLSSRTLTWNAPPDANVTPFAGVQSKGFQVNASVYPFPTRQTDGGLSGIGFTASLHHSAVSSVEFDNATDQTLDEYVINQNGWELGVHYRTPLSSLVTIDGGAFYGNQTYEILDASPNFEVPDTKYSYLGASAHLDLAITERAQIGFGARYFTVLDAGDLASTDWFGPTHASGLGLDASFMIPLPSNLYVRGQLSYQRISLDLSGGGQITDDEGVTDGTDALIFGSVNLGIAF